MTLDELQKIADTPGFGTGRAYVERRAQEAEVLALLPDRAWMAPVMASNDDMGTHWLVASFGCSGDDGHDWQLVTDYVRASLLGDAVFPADAKTDALAVAALCNAWRMGLIVLRPDLLKEATP